MGTFLRAAATAVCWLAVLAACTAVPWRPPPTHFRETSVWQTLYTTGSRTIVLQAAVLSDQSHSGVRLILEKERLILLRMDASSTFVSARGALVPGHWMGPPGDAPLPLRLWIAFALYQKGVTVGGFEFQGNAKAGRLSLTARRGSVSLEAIRKSFEP